MCQMWSYLLKCIFFFSLYINSKRKWARYDMRGKFLDQTDAPDIDGDWEILCMLVFRSLIKSSVTLLPSGTLIFFFFYSTLVMQIEEAANYYVVYWSGQINDTRLRFDTFKGDTIIEPLTFHSVMSPNKTWDKLYCCCNDNDFSVRIVFCTKFGRFF